VLAPLSLAAPPVEQLQIVHGGGFGFFLVQGAGGVDDVFQDEAGAAFGLSEGSVVVGRAGDGGAISQARRRRLPGAGRFSSSLIFTRP
jgi:hypothetical protein